MSGVEVSIIQTWGDHEYLGIEGVFVSRAAAEQHLHTKGIEPIESDPGYYARPGANPFDDAHYDINDYELKE